MKTRGAVALLAAFVAVVGWSCKTKVKLGTKATSKPRPELRQAPRPGGGVVETQVHFRSKDGFVIDGTLALPATRQGQRRRTAGMDPRRWREHDLGGMGSRALRVPRFGALAGQRARQDHHAVALL